MKTYKVVLIFLCFALVFGEASEKSDKSSEELKEIVPDTKRMDGDKTKLDKNEMIRQDPYGKLLQEKSMLDLGFFHAFIASLSVIIVSEIGDKTFFIAAIMAMRHSRWTVFLGAMVALGTMTVLSALLGFATTIIPRWFTSYASSFLFLLFGLKMLREGWTMSADEGLEEFEEAQEEVRKHDEVLEGMVQTTQFELDNVKAEQATQKDVESGVVYTRARRFLYKFVSRIFVESFTLTFLAEWGDRSQMATIILAAREEVIGVILGGTIGHALCTGLAVLGGRYVSQKISMRTVHLVGGVVFLIFAVSAFFIEPDD